MTTILPMDVDTVAIDAVTPHPDNPRRGDRAAVMSSLRTNGQYRPIVVQRSTGHIIAGNNTCAAARELGWDTIAVQYVDVDDRAAKRILATDNRTSDLADYDDEVLLALLEELNTTGDLISTGFDASVLDDLTRSTGALGDAATGFLDTFTAPAPAPPPATGDAPPAPEPARPGEPAPPTPAPHTPEPPPGPAAPAYTAITYTVTTAERDELRAAVRHAQTTHNLETQTDALMTIVRHYTATNPA